MPGEHGAWAKHANWHADTHVPLLLRVPGLTDGGVSTDAYVETIDLFPTLVEAAGLGRLPSCPAAAPWDTPLCTEGQSFLPLVREPSRPWKGEALSQYPRGGKKGGLMGYSMNTRLAGHEVRFTAWTAWGGFERGSSWLVGPSIPNFWAAQSGFELYNHTSDPQECLTTTCRHHRITTTSPLVTTASPPRRRLTRPQEDINLAYVHPSSKNSRCEGLGASVSVSVSVSVSLSVSGTTAWCVSSSRG